MVCSLSANNERSAEIPKCADEGRFFKTHKDTPRSEDMVASLVVGFPTSHEGGTLVLRHNEKEFTYDSGSLLDPLSSKIGYVAFFSDIVSGWHRVTLNYNLYASKSPFTPNRALHT